MHTSSLLLPFLKADPQLPRVVPLLLCRAEAGPSRKRSGSPLGSQPEHSPYGSSGRGEDGGPGASKRPTLHFVKCGECPCCLNPKLKKACVVVRLQRKEAGYPRS